MKKFISFLLTICICLSIGVIFSACNGAPQTQVDYTVTEAEWRVNFNLTKGQPQAQTLACVDNGKNEVQLFSSFSTQQLTEITSYTIYAAGQSGGATGNSLLKVAPNAMYIEFYLEGNLREDESGTFTSDTDFYKGLVKSVGEYFPFADYYNEFTFDQTKNAYVCQNLTSQVNDEYDVNIKRYIYTKSAEVTFKNGYLNTVTVEISDSTFTDVFGALVFTFSNINNTVV